MPVVGEGVVFRQRIGKVMFRGEAREGAQILGIGPHCVVANAAFIAAGVNEGGVIETGHNELLLWCPASASQRLNSSK
ncbi:MAG: hypothetical protein AAFO80_11540 [Pseudomonadota bacterium]